MSTKPRPAFSDFADQFVIRGFLNNQVVYRDGFRIDTGDSGKHETADIEQIEVLKGPASILYGRMEPGGLINYITKKPLPDSHYALQQQFGSFASYRTSLDATGPISRTSSPIASTPPTNTTALSVSLLAMNAGFSLPSCSGRFLPRRS